MNAVTATTCLLAAGFSCYLYGSDVLLSLLRVSVAETSMPEPGAAPRQSPQGVPYTDLEHIVNADGLHLFCRYWETTGPPRSVENQRVTASSVLFLCRVVREMVPIQNSVCVCRGKWSSSGFLSVIQSHEYFPLRCSMLIFSLFLSLCVGYIVYNSACSYLHYQHHCVQIHYSTTLQVNFFIY